MAIFLVLKFMRYPSDSKMRHLKTERLAGVLLVCRRLYRFHAKHPGQDTSSFIQTILLVPELHRVCAYALADCTANRELHPALKTFLFSCQCQYSARKVKAQAQSCIVLVSGAKGANRRSRPVKQAF